MQMCKADVWVIVDANGDYSVGTTQEDAIERHESEYGALNELAGYRLVVLPVSVPIPELQELPEVEVAAVGPAAVA